MTDSLSINPLVAIHAAHILSLLRKAGGEELQLTTEYSDKESEEAHVHALMTEVPITLGFTVNQETVDMDVFFQVEAGEDEKDPEASIRKLLDSTIRELTRIRTHLTTNRR